MGPFEHFDRQKVSHLILHCFGFEILCWIEEEVGSFRCQKVHQELSVLLVEEVALAVSL